MFAAKYIWWKTEAEAIRKPERIVAQVMELGDYDDVQKLVEQFGNQFLIQVLSQAQPGVFSAKSWAYWHYRLGLAQFDHLPKLPKRSFK